MNGLKKAKPLSGLYFLRYGDGLDVPGKTSISSAFPGYRSTA